MTDSTLSSTLKNIPIYGILKSVKYANDILHSRKLLKSYSCIIAIWGGVLIGGIFPFFIWDDCIRFTSELFYVDPNWFISIIIVLCCISFFSNFLYAFVKLMFYMYNYVSYGNIHSTFRPLSEKRINFLKSVKIKIDDIELYLLESQIRQIHENILNILKNKNEKEQTTIKLAFEKFMKGDVIGAMLISPVFSYIISESFNIQSLNINSTNDVSLIIKRKYTGLSMITLKVNNPVEATFIGRLNRLIEATTNMLEELSELQELVKNNDMMSLSGSENGGSIINLE